MFKRQLSLPESPSFSFFLWGPRQVGKSSLIKRTYPDSALYLDLLETSQYSRFLQDAGLLRRLVESSNRAVVVIDEVQKLPSLLDDVHWLIENRGTHFALCGSSARKLRHGHANLLGGRAVRYELHGLVASEIGDEFDLVRILNRGYMPRHYLSDDYRLFIESYVGDYLKEEIAAEGLVRNLPAFSSFLRAASFSDAELVSYSAIANDCGVSVPTVKGYFEILEDTLLGRFLPAFVGRQGRKVKHASKFYFCDCGIVNFLARRAEVLPGSQAFGKAFENWVFHELNAYRAYRRRDLEISYLRLESGKEVDFVLNDLEALIEVKGAEKVTSQHLKTIRLAARGGYKPKKRILVSLDPMRQRTEDGIELMPAVEFTRELWSGAMV